MKYMLMIHQGTTPTPLDPDAWATLSGDEQQATYADYRALANILPLRTLVEWMVCRPLRGLWARSDQWSRIGSDTKGRRSYVFDYLVELRLLGVDVAPAHEGRGDHADGRRQGGKGERQVQPMSERLLDEFREEGPARHVSGLVGRQVL
jgi:hypothetical protein